VKGAVARQRAIWIGSLLALQAVVIGVRTSWSCMWLDDFLNFEIYNDMHLSWAYLTRDVFGQVAPFYRLSQAVYFKLFGVTYLPAQIILGSLSLAITLFMILIAERARVDRRLISAAAIVQAFLVQFTQSQIWWATALHTLPSLALTMAAFWLLVAQGRDRRARVGAAVLFAAALMFTAKAMFAPLFIGAVLLYLHRRELPWRDAIRAACRDLVLFIPVAAGYAVLVLTCGPKSQPPPPTFRDGLEFVWLGFADGTLADTLGVGRQALPLPHGLALAIALGSTLAVALVTVRRRPAVAVVWAALLAYLLISLSTVARVRAFRGSDVGLSPRYHCEGSTFLLMTLLLSAAGLTLVRWQQALVLTLAVLIAVDLQLESKRVHPIWGIEHSCEYLHNLQTDLADIRDQPNVVLLDGPVPGEIMADWMTPYNVMQSFLPLFTATPVMGSDRANYEVSRDGHVRRRQ
jgi:hypothetical protein